MPFRFVHAADIHLDSPLRSLALRDPALGDLIGNATRRAFIGIVDLCLDEHVDALLLSGDLYDGDQTSMKTARFLADQIRRLHEAAIAVFMIRGNHDALSRITRELTYPLSVKVFGGRAESVEIERDRGVVPIAIHGISFAQPHAPESLLARFKPPIDGAVNIGMLHTSVGGSPGHDPYAPCELAELHRAGFRYWALGHIHRRSTEHGEAIVVMPGMPQGRDIGEAGAKSATLVTVMDDGSLLLEERPTSIAQFERVPLSVGGIEDWRDMVRELARVLGQARDAVGSEHLVARIRLTGETALAWRLRRDADLLRTEAEDQAAALGKTWIDKVEIDCRAPDGGPASTGADRLVELRRLMDEAAGDEAYLAEIATIAEELRGQLPVEIRSMLGTNASEFSAGLSEAVRDGIDDVLARLRAGSEAGTG